MGEFKLAVKCAAVGAAACMIVCVPACRDPWDARKPDTSSELRATSSMQPVIEAPTVVRWTRPWRFEDTTGTIVRTDQFVIYTTERTPLIADRLPGLLEAAHAHQRTALGILPPAKRAMETYVLNDRQQWANLTQQMLGERSRPLLNITRGGFTTQGTSLLFDIGAFDTLAIAAHESWHQYTQTTFVDPLPLWAEEGVATYMEGHRWDGPMATFLPWANVARFDRLVEASRDGDLLPLEEVLMNSPNAMIGLPDGQPGRGGASGGGGASTGGGARADGRKRTGSEPAIVWYSQVWALMHFLSEGEGGKYRPMLEQMLKDAAEGRLNARVRGSMGLKAGTDTGPSRGPGMLATIDPLVVFRAYFGPDVGKISREYQAYVAAMVRAARQGRGGGVPMGRSPLAGME
jgi:hypothetical protein